MNTSSVTEVLWRALDLDRIERYFTKLDPGQRVGYSNLPHECPIAWYLQEQGFRSPRVGTAVIRGYLNDHLAEVEMVHPLMRMIDEVTSPDTRMMTAGEVCACIRRIKGEA